MKVEELNGTTHWFTGALLDRDKRLTGVQELDEDHKSKPEVGQQSWE